MKYCIVKDDSGHDYIIPFDRSGDWNSFLESQDAQDGVLPKWAREIGWHPSRIAFENPTGPDGKPMVPEDMQ